LQQKYHIYLSSKERKLAEELIVEGVKFIKAGVAVNTDKRAQGADFKIDKEYKDKIGVVYLFICRGEIVYIGVTEKKIQDRMNMYASNTSGSTNKKMRKNLKEDGQYAIYIHMANEVTIGNLKTTNELTIEKALIQNISTKYNMKIPRIR
jgi:hypothetical protein